MAKVELRASCSAALGMSPGQYQRLRRLAKVRTELLLVKPVTVDATEVIARYGFASLHHFVAEYWDAYGEMPPIAPRSPITP
jgi:AraC-like DNA-binding protein